MKAEILDKLVKSGILKEYSFRVLDMDSQVVSAPGNGSRETDELTLVFSNGEKLIIGTFCSGCAENTSIIIE